MIHQLSCCQQHYHLLHTICQSTYSYVSYTLSCYINIMDNRQTQTINYVANYHNTTYSTLLYWEVSEAENTLNEMLEAGFQPNIFVLTSLIQCYEKATNTDDVVRTVKELSIVPDDRFCGCLLNVLTQIPTKEIDKVFGCIERVNVELGSLVKLLVDEGTTKEVVKHEAGELFGKIS